jgi:hypothetical protein
MSAQIAAQTKAANWSAREIEQAQFALDHHPTRSPFWDSESAQDVLQCIEECDLTETTTESWRREWHRDAMRACQEGDE